jgi:hypothetical protein
VLSVGVGVGVRTIKNACSRAKIPVSAVLQDLGVHRDCGRFMPLFDLHRAWAKALPADASHFVSSLFVITFTFFSSFFLNCTYFGVLF